MHAAVSPQETWTKIGGVPPFWRMLGLHLTQCGLAEVIDNNAAISRLFDIEDGGRPLTSVFKSSNFNGRYRWRGPICVDMPKLAAIGNIVTDFSIFKTAAAAILDF